ncbi:MAG: ATP-binding cassette domain-containing protein [Clostridia bacterium]|nr:ATP-binding cassette domain-containing protein [Clostridia bacterium]
MLQLKNITKIYGSGSTAVTALNGVSLTFRHSEFVSILGQSGCGKTTLLNLVGGLDRYTDGDLVINGKSTRTFGDRDWDTYRNHTIGFVFQSYNLIPHQSVLQNVELALSLSGVSKKERRRRAKEALEQVGLGDQLKKKPGEMSGGQMQRVAIARALVNNPDIILADEPTGALDTETSVQVMEILKEVSKDRLVVMVTHNPELAEKYSTRIIRMLDGKVTGDSAPLSPEEIATEEQLEQAKAPKGKKREKKPSLSFATSFGLSLKNLFTKKGRTILTSFAGSIGIIGIALIYAVSQGMTTYIDTVQEETLSSYPLTLEATHIDMGTLLTTFMGQAQAHGSHDKDAVYQKTMFYDLVNALNNMEANENDLKSFKKHLQKELEKGSTLSEAITGVQYSYNLNLPVYTENVDGTVILSDSQQLLQDLLLEYFGMDLSSMMNMSESYGFGSGMAMGGGATLWQEMLPGKNGELINPLLEKQYELIDGGRWPTAYNEILLVVDENNEIDDMTLYALGLKSKEDIDALANAAIDKSEVEVKQESWSYEEIRGMEFRTVYPAACYTLDPVSGLYTDLRDSQTGLKYLYDNGIPLKVTGIIRPKEDAVAGMLTGSIAYTSALTAHIIENAADSAAVEAQMADTATDIFTGLPFKDTTGSLTDAEKEQEFRAYIEALSEQGKADAYVKVMSIPSAEQLDSMVAQALSGMTRETMEDTLRQALAAQMGMGEKEIGDYLASMNEEDITELFTKMAEERSKMQYAAGVQAQMAPLPAAQKVMALTAAMDTFSAEQFATYYDEVLEFSETSYEDNLIALGRLDLDNPSAINIYASSFENKDIIEEAIADYNEDKDELSRIVYTDYVGLMMSSITTIINAITYVLIAFVAISLVVSSIMIGVITLISVQERTKEIGILRAIGASKRNVSRMFNAETMIIGFASGALGVGITYLLCIPINLILHHLTGINNLSAILPLPVAAVLVIISMLLTLISGIIPSRSAAKKDPVVALRTE